MEAKFITLNGASVNLAHILSFESEKEFVSAKVDSLYPKYPEKERKNILKSMYKIAKKTSETV